MYADNDVPPRATSVARRPASRQRARTSDEMTHSRALAAALRRLRPQATQLRPLERALGSLRPRLLTSGTPYGAVSVGVPKESYANERRVALTPASVAVLLKNGVKAVCVEKGAGVEAKFSDAGTDAARLPRASMHAD
jgi:NAD(P) transhydrogenase